MTFEETLEDELRSILSGEFSISLRLAVDDAVFPEINGIFDKTYLQFIDSDIGIQSRNPKVAIYINDIESELDLELDHEEQKITIEIKNKKYNIDHIQKDGTGFGIFYLKLDE